jgi:hypothetical protein
MACRGQTTSTHLKKDVRVACDCDIAFAICEFARPRLFVASQSRNAFIDDDAAVARRYNPG